MSAYYNEIDPYCVAWLRNLITAGAIPPGDVDDRSIKDVQPDDLTGYTQCHFFAGLGGWPYALRLAGWPDDREIWTGSCPCQPFSVAGKGAGTNDARHLWPDFHRLIKPRRPAVVMGEQVSGALGRAWFDGVASDMEADNYTPWAVDIPAASVNAPEQRNRLYWLAGTDNAGLALGPFADIEQGSLWGEGEAVITGSARDGRLGGTGPCGRRPDTEGWHVNERADAGRQEEAGGSELAGAELPGGMGSAVCQTGRQERSSASCDEKADGRAGRNILEPNGDHGFTGSGEVRFWDDWELIGPDPEGKFRRIKPGITPLDTRLPGHVGQIRAYGNAINAELAAEVIRAYMDVTQ
jgi:DNA (cytosine-5)-methyltransferase 1